ncbi:hypothetical protein [Wenyingzhuangia sp. IMCC45574]
MNTTELKSTNQVKNLHLVSFDVPYPPSYGGVIDVFYKIKALSALGVQIYLHTFEYGRGEQTELEKYCEKVFYYPRKSFWKSFLSTIPYIVKSREHVLLEKRLKELSCPILFEGLHSASYLKNQSKIDVKTIVRMHNIEHDYYEGLARSERNFLKKVFFSLEALKLKKYQTVLNKCDCVLTISPLEQNYFSSLFGENCHYLPVFSDTEFSPLKEVEKFVLWHGDLRVSDNVKSALWAIEIVENTTHKLIIASSTRDEAVFKACQELENVIFNDLNTACELGALMASANVNLLFTFQVTGIKLKLLNTLVKSRYIIANDKIIQQTGLEDLCVEGNTTIEIRNLLDTYMFLDFPEQERVRRKEVLKAFDTQKNAQKIMDLMC